MKPYTPKSRKGSFTSSRYSSEFPASSGRQQGAAAAGAKGGAKKRGAAGGTGRKEPPRRANESCDRTWTATQHRATVWAAQRGETARSVPDGSAKQSRRAAGKGLKNLTRAAEH